MKRLLLSAFVLLGACASAPGATSGVSHPEEAAILATVDAALLAAGNRDGAAAAKVFTPDGWTFLQRRTAAVPEGAVAKRSVQSFLAPAAGADPFIERYWEPVVQVRGGIAQVWAPYELRDNGAVVHCGIDAFQLVKMDGAWKVASLMFTMEPEACEEIGLPEVSKMRPRDGWREAPLQ